VSRPPETVSRRARAQAAEIDNADLNGDERIAGELNGDELDGKGRNGSRDAREVVVHAGTFGYEASWPSAPINDAGVHTARAM
jgi:hypothetical protein